MARRNGVAERRQQLDRILGSPEFAGSRQVREFLAFVGEAALQDRTHLDQVEIAAHVLQREGDFNPVDDTSIRKLASITRHKLEHYYQTRGSRDSLEVTLPPRVYIPQFRLRREPAPWMGGLRRWLVAVSVAALAVLLAWKGISGAPERRFVLTTRGGDIGNKPIDLAPDGLRIGIEVGSDEEAVGRMFFTPSGANQHAGLMVYEGPDQYVKFGRRFWSRVETEFGIASRGTYSKPPGTFAYDPRGQDGSPLWITIRRHENQFQAYRSADGDLWQRVGETLTMPDPMRGARLAAYAMQEAIREASARAEFDQLGVGLSFHNREDGPFDGEQFSGWKSESNCAEPPALRIERGALEYSFSRRKKCSWEFSREVPPGDWALVAKLDQLNFDGAGAGIAVIGPKRRFRLIRWNVEGGSVSAQLIPGAVVSKPDFKGSPPLWLRISCRRGSLNAAFSRDNHNFTTLPVQAGLADLGPNPRFGLLASTHSWTSSETLPSARFYYVRREVLSLTDFR